MNSDWNKVTCLSFELVITLRRFEFSSLIVNRILPNNHVSG